MSGCLTQICTKFGIAAPNTAQWSVFRYDVKGVSYKRMSLKAKLEAVIYAAEEPVTLAQFALLFAEDALLWKEERVGANLRLALPVESAEEALHLEESGEPVAEAADSTAELADLVRVAGEAEPLEQSTAPQGQSEAPGLPVPEASVDVAEVTPEAATKPAAEFTIDPELEARRVQRAREAEVRKILREALDELIGEYASDARGIEIREIAGGFRMGTKPEIHDAVRVFIKSLKPPMKLSLPALETLAVIAYKQPVTAPEVGEIRGVDSAGVLGSLISRKLIATAGRKQVIGRPMLYKTTKEFLLRFGLKDVNELPSMEEFEKMAALELNEESLEDENGDPAAPAAQTGDLFEETESSETEEPNEIAAESNPVSTETTTPEPSHEAPSGKESEEHAIVERQNAEEVEAQS
jgi:segregation and condensation protein B